ncbi:MAG TPA: sn-glycerol-3-phosphate ABC transporter permease UgpE [Rubrivivax sp.]|nr:sn-glycerol-3-phosphate ABC transporter permease UgpE [Burkholderiales bacterium]HNT40248.1 sn-glycerol-3-phosphate ABC transporter permease UgpE [Rubrivivax sp.]
MVENRPAATMLSHLVLMLGVLIIAFPLYITFIASTQTSQQIVQNAPMSLLPGGNMLETYRVALGGDETSYGQRVPPVAPMMMVSLISALVISIGKIAISLLSAFAFVYFRFPGRGLCFWMVFVTLMLPVEVRIFPTYQVISDLKMLNTYAGLTVPLIASATATFLFRQFFLTVPDELVEAARIDGAGPLRFFKDVLLPLSATSVAALFVIQFIYGWNQYLWPLLVTTSEDMYPVVMGIKRMFTGGDAANEWNVIMATAVLAMIPPALVVLLMQKWFVKGLVDSEK